MNNSDQHYVNYTYDGTFEGLLTCVHEHYYLHKAAGIFRRDEYQFDMLREHVDITTDLSKSDKVYDAVVEKISYGALAKAYKAFLSHAEEKEMAILNYLRLGFIKGPAVHSMLDNDIVDRVEKAVRSVVNEAERMRQFTRFIVLENGVSFASIEPESDCLELIARHFADRFNDAPFIICDRKRCKAIIAFDRKWEIHEVDPSVLPDEADDEEAFAGMWKDYFNTIAIKERKNSDLQRSNVPKKYRKYMTEML